FDIRQQLGERLIETEVRYGPRDPAVFDEERAVASQAGERDGAWIERSDVPEARDEHATLYGFDHVVERCIAARHDEVRWIRFRRHALLHCPEAGIRQSLQYALFNPGLTLT